MAPLDAGQRKMPAEILKRNIKETSVNHTKFNLKDGWQRSKLFHKAGSANSSPGRPAAQSVVQSISVDNFREM